MRIPSSMCSNASADLLVQAKVHHQTDENVDHFLRPETVQLGLCGQPLAIILEGGVEVAGHGGQVAPGLTPGGSRTASDSSRPGRARTASAYEPAWPGDRP